MVFCKEKFTYDNIEELKQDVGLKIGNVIELNGYYTAGDGANHKRIIANKDDGSGVQLANKLWANIVHNGEVNISWFGASENNSPQKNSTIIFKATTFAKNKKISKVIFGKGNNYKVCKREDRGVNIINFSSDTNYIGNGSTIEITGSDSNYYLFYNLTEDIIENTIISGFNFKLEDDYYNPKNTLIYNAIVISLTQCKNVTVVNNKLNRCMIYLAVETTKTKQQIVENCVIENNILLNDNYRENLSKVNLTMQDVYPNPDGTLTPQMIANRRKARFGCGFGIRLIGSFGSEYRNGSGGIRNNIVRNNIIKYTTYSGIEIVGRGTKNNIISNNYFEGCEGTAIETDKGCCYNIIENNFAKNSNSTITYLQGGKPIIQATYQTQRDSEAKEFGYGLGNILKNNSVLQETVDYPAFRDQTTDFVVDGLYIDEKSTKKTAIIIATDTSYDSNFIFYKKLKNIIDFRSTPNTIVSFTPTTNLITNLELKDSVISKMVANAGNKKVNISIENVTAYDASNFSENNYDISIKNCTLNGLGVLLNSGNIYIDNLKFGKELTLYSSGSQPSKVASLRNVISNDSVDKYTTITIKDFDIINIEEVDIRETSSTNLDFLIDNSNTNGSVYIKNVIGSKNKSLVVTAGEKIYVNTKNIGLTQLPAKLSTSYMATKMQQENVYDDYISYIDEKTAYDKQQEKLEEQRQTAYQEMLKENPELTYEEFLSVQPMVLNLVEELQPSARLQEFMKKYL